MKTTEAPLTNEEIVNLICANTERVFTTMLGLSPRAAAPRIDSDNPSHDSGVICLVGFAGQWSGSGIVRCGESLARLISGKLLLTDFNCVNDEVLDAMGEIANMIIGNFKDDAAYRLGPLGLSTPTVIYGNNFQARNWNGQSWIAVEFDCDGAPLEVKVCLVPSRVLQELHTAGIATH